MWTFVLSDASLRPHTALQFSLPGPHEVHTKKLKLVCVDQKLVDA